MAQEIPQDSAMASDDPIELEEQYHDVNSFVSVKAIEHELKYLELLLLKFKDSPDEL